MLLGPAERADVIVDFGTVPVGTALPPAQPRADEPFGGFPPDDPDDVAVDPDTTGQVMQFRVAAATSVDTSTPPSELIVHGIEPLPAVTNTRKVSLNEVDSETVRFSTDTDGNLVLDCEGGETFGPKDALLGTLEGEEGVPRSWDDLITENPAVGAIEVWELHNFCH